MQTANLRKLMAKAIDAMPDFDGGFRPDSIFYKKR